MKAIQLLINSKLPPSLRDSNLRLDAKGVEKLLQDVGREYPEKYAELAKMLSDVGRNQAYINGETVTLADLKPVIDKDGLVEKMNAEVAALKKAGLKGKEFNNKRLEIWSKYSDLMEKQTLEVGLKNKNNLALAVASGARGKAPQLKAMLSAPGLYSDFKDAPIPIFIDKSFAEGVRPAHLLAGSFGARKSVIATKVATAKGGDLSKLMVQSSAPLGITMEDCGTNNGIDLAAEDDSAYGRVLAAGAKGFPAGTVLDRKTYTNLVKAKPGKIIVRSPLTCQAPHGICAKCAGLIEGGKLPKIGEAVGVSSAQAIGEPITQGALNTKHQSGAFKGKKVYSGFNVISNLVQSPQTFPDRAEVAETYGRVERIVEAPQGGYHIYVNGVKHYAGPDYPVLVKEGDVVEPGDQLSDGVVDPKDIIRLRGIGEGRRYYADRLHQALEESGLGNSKRNAEMLARASVNFIQVHDPDGLGNYLPDDVVNYNQFLTQYKPPEDVEILDLNKTPEKAVEDFYLQAPVLHYSIGTKLTPKMRKRIKESGITKVPISKTEPAFSPVMVNLRKAPQKQTDWMARLHSSYIKSNLLDSAERGLDTHITENVHFAPRLAYGEDFGKKLTETGKF